MPRNPRLTIEFEPGLVKAAINLGLQIYNFDGALQSIMRELRPGEIIPPNVVPQKQGLKEFVRVIDVDGERGALEAAVQIDMQSQGSLYNFVAGYLAANGKLTRPEEAI